MRLKITVGGKVVLIDGVTDNDIVIVEWVNDEIKVPHEARPEYLPLIAEAIDRAQRHKKITKRITDTAFEGMFPNLRKVPDEPVSDSD